MHQHGALHRGFLIHSLAVADNLEKLDWEETYKQEVCSYIVCHFLRQKLVRPWPYQLYLCRRPCSYVSVS